MSNRQNHNHELQEGQEVSLGIRPHHLSTNAENHQAHSAEKHHPLTETVKADVVHQSHHPKINLHPGPNQSRVSPFKPEPKKRRFRESVKAIRAHRHWHNAKLVIGTVLVFFLLFNSQWFISQFMYTFNKPKQPSPAQTNQQQATVPAESAEVVGPNNEIIIPKIGVTAPLVFVNTTNESEVLVALRGGVVHYYGTAYPGENGNAAFFGHSSNDWWEPGDYKFVFVLLEKLTVGDTYEIHYNSRKYVYKVTQTKTVEPNDLSVLNQTATPTSTLITCTPPGTSLKRFVVSAEQISPKPAQAVASSSQTPTTPASKLPSAPPSLWQQLVGVFNGLFGTGDRSNGPTSNDQPTPNRLPEIKN